MRVRIPNLLVLESIAIDRQATCAVAGSRVATLHHEAIDDPVEAVALVVILGTLLASAECAEVLRSLWHVLVENLKDDAARLEAFLAFFAYRHVKVGLHVVLIKLWQLVVVLGSLYCGLIVVDAFREEGGKTFLLLGGESSLLFLDGLELGSQVAVCWSNFDCCLDVVHSFSKLTNFHVGNTTQVKCLRRLSINLNSFCAVLNCVSEVASVVRAHGHVL